MIRTTLLAIIMALAVGTAHAKDASGTPAEASMLVTGTVDITTDGSVSSYAINDEEALPGYVLDLIRKFSGGWRFEPVVANGEAVAARAPMTLRIRAMPLENDAFEVSISSATFGAADADDTASVTSKRMRPPQYPPTAAYWGAGATVYLLLKIGRDGLVADSFVEQVNLNGKTDDKTMDLLRTRFAEASRDAARRWTFTPPSTGEASGDAYWLVRVPIDYSMNTRKVAAYGQWETYVPGPRHAAPWLETPIGGNDAMAGGTFQLAGQGLRLLTPLQTEG